MKEPNEPVEQIIAKLLDLDADDISLEDDAEDCDKVIEDFKESIKVDLTDLDEEEQKRVLMMLHYFSLFGNFATIADMKDLLRYTGVIENQEDKIGITKRFYEYLQMYGDKLFQFMKSDKTIREEEDLLYLGGMDNANKRNDFRDFSN